jgi:hypothetical protein
VLFVQAAWAVLAKEQMWERYGLEGWIVAAQKRLHPNVLAIALVNKVARIASAVLAKGRNFEVIKTPSITARSCSRCRQLWAGQCPMTSGYLHARPESSASSSRTRECSFD